MEQEVIITRENIMDYNHVAESLGKTAEDLWTPSMEQDQKDKHKDHYVAFRWGGPYCLTCMEIIK